MAKYRENIVSPTALIRLDSTERKYVSKELKKELASENVTNKEAAGILSLCYILGRDYESVLNLNVSDYFSTCLTKYKIVAKLGEQQWVPNKSDKDKFEDMVDRFELPLPEEIACWLKKTHIPKKGKKICDSLKTSQKKLHKRILKTVECFRNDFSMHIDLPRICAALKSEIFTQYQNVILAYIILNKSDLDPPHTRFYYIPSLKEIEDAWSYCQNKLWGNFQVEQLSLLEPLKWNGWVIKHKILVKFVEELKELPNQNDLVAFHNAYTRYVICFLIWNLGHRAARDPFAEEEKFCLETKRILILDKYKHGEANLRVLPLTKTIHQQLTYYYEHLVNIGSRLEQSNDKCKTKEDLKRYIQRLVASKDLEQKRLFFLISDSYKLNVVSESQIQKWFNQFGLPVKANFGRHYMASKLITEQKISYELTQFFLGHSMREKTQKNSELTIDQCLNVLDVAIEKIINQDGWSALKGFRFSGSKNVTKKSHYKPSSDFYPTRMPGYITRQNSQIELRKKVIKLSKEIIEHIKYTIHKRKSDQSKESIQKENEKREKVEKELKEKIRGLNFPYHSEWSSLRSYIRTEFDDKNPLPNVLKFQNLSTGTSQLRNNLHSKSNFGLNAQRNWIFWVNNHLVSYLSNIDQQDYQIKKKAVLVINAAILGGVLKSTTLNALLRRNVGNDISYTFKTYQTCSISHIEIFRCETSKIQKEEIHIEETWIDRWLPDPLSNILLADNDLDSNKVINEMKLLSYTAGLNLNKQNIVKSLTNCVTTIDQFKLPLFQHAIASGKMVSRPHSQNSWARHLTGKKITNKKDNEIESLVDELKESNLVNISESVFEVKNHKALIQIKQEIKNICKSDQLNKFPTRKQKCEFISNQLAHLENRIKNIPFTLELFFSWARFLSERGTRGYSTHGKLLLKAVTINQYLSKLYTVFFVSVEDENLFKFPNIELMTESEITEFYRQKLIEEKDKSTAFLLKRLIYMFHCYARDIFGISDFNWDLLDGVPEEYHPPRSGDIISESEYQEVLSTLFTSLKAANFVEILSHLFLAIMMFRFGLRPSEAFKLQPNELIFDKKNNLISVHIRKNYWDETKTRNAVRKVPATQSLSALEDWVLGNIYERALAYKEISPYFALTSLSVLQESRSSFSKRMVEATNQVSLSIRRITGDEKISAYCLRHSFATQTVANLLDHQCNNQHLQSLYSTVDISPFLEGQAYSKKLKNFSIVVGHKSVTTTLRTYTHCSELFNATNYSQLDQINDEVYAFLIGKTKGSYQTQKHRLKTHRATVESYIRKSKRDSLESTCIKRKVIPILEVEDIEMTVSKPLHIAELLFVKSRERFKSRNSIYSLKSLHITEKALKKVNKRLDIKGLASYFQKSKIADFERLFVALSTNSELLDQLFKQRAIRTKIEKQIELWFKVRTNNCKWVFLNENEVTSIISLMRKLGIDAKPTLRQSSYQLTCNSRKIEIQHYNHAGNSIHPDKERKKNGYEVVFEISDDFSNMKTIELYLIVIVACLEIDNLS